MELLAVADDAAATAGRCLMMMEAGMVRLLLHVDVMVMRLTMMMVRMNAMEQRIVVVGQRRRIGRNG